MSDDITTGREANFAVNLGIAKTLVETFESLNRVLVAAVMEDNRERVEYLGTVLQVVSDNISTVQCALDDHDAEFEAVEDEEHTAVTVVDQDGGKHGVLGYTITVQRPGSDHVEHAGEVFDIFANATRVFETIEDARAALGTVIFEPGSTVHISEVYTVEDIETITK